MVNMYADFDPLEEIILGDVAPELVLDPFLSQIWQEVRQDIDQLQSLLETRAVKVLRPNIIKDLTNGQVQFNDKIVAERCGFPLAIRDFYLVAGNNILLTYGSYSNRYFEDWHLYELFMNLHKQGSGFESMPKPPSFNHPEFANRKSQGCDLEIRTNEDQIINKLYKIKTLSEAKAMSLEYDQRFMIYRTYLKDTLAFHAAGVAHCGDTLIRTRCGSQLGCDWFDRWAQRNGFKVSALEYRHGHIDGQMTLIRPGLMVADRRFYHALVQNNHALAKWDCITVDYENMGSGLRDMDKIIETGNFDQYKSWLDEWGGMDQAFSFDVNLLSLNHNTVIVPETRSPILDELDKRGIDIIQTPWRHRFFIKNGIHCCSLETKRKGTAEQYL